MNQTIPEGLVEICLKLLHYEKICYNLENASKKIIEDDFLDRRKSLNNAFVPQSFGRSAETLY